MDGAQGRNRTTDTRIFSPLLYRLSYLGISGRAGFLEEGSGDVQRGARAGSGRVALSVPVAIYPGRAILVLHRRDRIAAAKPFGEVDIGTALRAEGPEF